MKAINKMAWLIRANGDCLFLTLFDHIGRPFWGFCWLAAVCLVGKGKPAGYYEQKKKMRLVRTPSNFEKEERRKSPVLVMRDR